MPLPHCDELFERFFLPWHDRASRERRTFRATFPDMERSAEARGRSVEEICPLTDADRADALEYIELMTGAAIKDFRGELNLQGVPDLSWVDAVDRHYDEARVERLIAEADPTDFSNGYVVVACEFGTLLGAVMISLGPRLRWLPERPYWDSQIFDPASGNRIAVFSWAVKKLSSYGIDDGFADKLQVCLDVCDRDAEAAASPPH